MRALRDPERIALNGEVRVEVRGAVWESAVEIATFADSEGAWARVFYRRKGNETYRTYPDSEVRVLTSATGSGAAAEVFRYWRDVVAGLPGDDPLVRPYGRLSFVNPESALGAYLAGAPITPREPTGVAIFPFRCNLSQRQAVENALTRSVSVIQGPPGTGKTETILNLIANITVRDRTVGVVSHSNSAVDNVREKLVELGFGHVLASLGKQEKRKEFFAGQADRNARVAGFAAETPPPPEPGRLADVDRRLRRLQSTERTLAQRRHEVAAYGLEREHFERHLHGDEMPDLSGLPLLRRSSGRILDYLAESELERNGARPGLIRRIRKYFRYGSVRGLDPEDTDVVLRLQRAYYTKRIAELDKEIAQLDEELRRADFDRLAQEHRQLSVQALHAHLGARYGGLARKEYDGETYRRSKEFRDFIEDYPVLLSTCHSLSSSIEDGFLLDHLIIDEASQVDPLVAGLALACCRNLVVVGDAEQLPPIPAASAADHEAPSPAYDCRRSILGSLETLYGEALPSALLREHYRCDPAIIGFCNKKFYRDELIPYTTGGDGRPMIVVRTVEGNHMRRHRTGGRSNRREVEVIETEVIPDHCAEVDAADIGITTPYRLQADKARDLLDQIASDTVHKFQGRQKKVVVMTTVLDETWRGRSGLPFADDPHLINVAVSRAIERFILVTNNDMLPTSRHIRDLIGHIRYHDLDEDVVDSAVVSIFDLLYQQYSLRLRSLAGRLKNERAYKSEDIAWTVLHEVLAEQRYEHLTVVAQVLVKSLFPDLSVLTPEQAKYAGNRASVDFVIYNRVTNRPLLAIEVDGFAYHENKPEQLRRDELKNQIFRTHDMPLLRLPTTGSGEQRRIRQALDEAETHWAQQAQ
ncbi:AAA domain-containing protein [Saccharopolyspora gloriosae]|uniref:AAA domain-containing protein n=1 Tax=Saccharopolyspora gloriosae TaxID=455344 RepID=UPI001FB70086|nr:AAA domain-containing protein [Saccharopolyspora gloriosae]